MKETGAVIYIRVSTEEQAVAGTSLTTQKEACLKFAESRGAFVVKICEDAGVSGAKYETRPGLQEALSLIESGKANLLIVYKLDRLARTTRIMLQTVERVTQAGGTLVSTLDNQEYGKSSPTGHLMLSVLASVAELERATIRERSMTGRKARAVQGLQPARTTAPYGYRIPTNDDITAGRYEGYKAGEYIIEETEASVVRQIFTRYAAGDSLRSLGKSLYVQGIPSPKGCGTKNSWFASTLHGILRNATYKGEGAFGKKETLRDERRITQQGFKTDMCRRIRQKEDVITFPVPAIVSPEQWEACQRRLDRNKATMNGRGDRRYMLSGLVSCPMCGHRLSGKKHGGGYSSYACQPRYCGHGVQFGADRVELGVIENLRHLAAHPENIVKTLRAYDRFKESQGPEATEDRRVELTAKLAELETKGTAIAKAQVAALMAGASESHFAPLFAEVKEQRTVVEKELAALPKPETRTDIQDVETPAKKIAETIEALGNVLTAPEDKVSIVEKQSLLAGVIEQVVPRRLTEETTDKPVGSRRKGRIPYDYEVSVKLLPIPGLTVHTVLTVLYYR